MKRKKLMLVDIVSLSRDKKLYGHAPSVARSYYNALRNEFDVILAGSYLYKIEFPENKVIVLPFSIKEKDNRFLFLIKGIINVLYTFSFKSNIIIFQNQFLSPLSNHRTDDYGGNLVKRTQFLFEILQAVRQVFTGEVWVRLSVEEYAEGGHHVSDTISVVARIQSMIAGVNVSSGGVVPYKIQPAPGYQLPFAKALKEAGTPTIGGGLLTSLVAIEEALQSSCDLVYLGRELLLNPYFVLQMIKKHAPERMLKA
jgi:hypothetical protein